MGAITRALSKACADRLALPPQMVDRKFVTPIRRSTRIVSSALWAAHDEHAWATSFATLVNADAVQRHLDTNHLCFIAYLHNDASQPGRDLSRLEHWC